MDKVFILGIESSCDETSASVICNETVLSNVIAGQALVHQYYGGVVPELASRAHQQKIIPVVEEALRKANITKNDLHAVAFTRGPGLMGALLVGVSFAKSFAMALQIPLIDVNHMQGHILAHFIQKPEKPKKDPSFPFLCLTVSGGHTQIVRINSPLEMEILGQTNDDAAGEAFDKTAKILGLPYPGGPLIDQHAKKGDSDRFKFPHPHAEGLNFSFSGLKTAILYFVRDHQKDDPGFVQDQIDDICASVQKTIIEILMAKLRLAIKQTGIKQIAIAGGVSANSGLRTAIRALENEGCETFIPEFEFCTDNAAMIAITGYFKYLKGEFCDLNVTPIARY
jgi:N6-L-threonylcarbamoyladenine synthase